MVFSIFRPPSDGESVAECRLGDICDATDFSYEPYFCGVGTFELKLPITSAFSGILQPNTLLYTPRFGGFIIKNILRTESEVKLTGYDLNGILRDRLTLTAEDTPDGKDEVKGTTEYCVKYYVANNLISAVDNNRNIPRLETAENGGRGLQGDHYLASPENLEDVVRTMCENAKLGYRISMNINAGSINPVFTFDVSERFDAKDNGGQRPAFSIGLGNIAALTREVGVTAEKNALWCDTGSAPQFVFKEETPPVSWERREDFVSLSLVDNTDGDEIRATARQVMADKYAQTDSLTVTAGNISEYGAGYKLGDIVTVFDKRNNALLESWISGAEIKLTATEQSVKLILGSAKPKVLDGLAKKSDLLKKSQSDFPPAEGGGGDTFNDAIILTQGDLPYILHSYSVVEYRKGWAVIAQGPDANIITNGYIAYSPEIFTSDAAMYSALQFSGSNSLSTAPTPNSWEIKVTQSGRDSDYSSWNIIYSYNNGVAKRGGMKCYGGYGLALKFGIIYAPNNIFVNGCAAISIYIIYQNKSGSFVVDTANVFNGYVEFGSIAEYNAAIRLTKEPLIGGEVIETTVTDDGNSTLEKAMMYTDKVAETLQQSITNISESDREQIAQNASDIAAHDVRITAVEGEVDTINAPNGGILSQSKSYTDFVADELRGEFGT